MMSSRWGLKDRKGWRKRVALVALLSLLLQPFVTASMAFAAASVQDEEASFNADLLYTCYYGQLADTAGQSQDDQDQQSGNQSCPWCLAKNAPHGLKAISLADGLLVPTSHSLEPIPVTTNTSPESLFRDDASPRAPPFV